MLIPCSGVDYFHHLLHRMIEDHGGGGNVAQLRLRLDGPLDERALARAWRAMGADAWVAGAQWRATLRGPAWSVRGTGRARARSRVQRWTPPPRPASPAAWARAAASSLTLCDGGSSVLAMWDHRLCDARGVLGLLARLPELARGGRLREGWWRPPYRLLAELPPSARERGVLARQTVEHLRPHRAARLWRPPLPSGNRALPLVEAHLQFSPAETLRVDARAVAASGRFSETPFLLACLAAALAELAPGDGDVLFPLAIDARTRLRAPLLSNCHSFLFLRQPRQLALDDLPSAARHFKESQRRWVAGEMPLKMAAALQFFPCVGERLARLQLGYFTSGIAASCLVGNAGVASLPDPWFGARIASVGHATAIPGSPGISTLFHRFAGCLSCDIIAVGAAARVLPPARLVARLRHHLLLRDFPGSSR